MRIDPFDEYIGPVEGVTGTSEEKAPADRDSSHSIKEWEDERRLIHMIVRAPEDDVSGPEPLDREHRAEVANRVMDEYGDLDSSYVDGKKINRFYKDVLNESDVERPELPEAHIVTYGGDERDEDLEKRMDMAQRTHNRYDDYIGRDSAADIHDVLYESKDVGQLPLSEEDFREAYRKVAITEDTDRGYDTPELSDGQGSDGLSSIDLEAAVESADESSEEPDYNTDWI